MCCTKRIKMKHYSIVAILITTLPLAAAGPQMTVYKTRTCGCCAKWVDHLKANGFDVTVQDVPSTAEYRQKYGVPEKLASCHTAVVKGYAIEGHVPASDITRLLKTAPKAKGLAAPGMPAGSPGMEGPRSDAYSVLLFDAKGESTVFKTYAGN
jgi:hypothetical protein